MAHPSNLSTQEAETEQISEFEASQVYRAIPRTAWAVCYTEKPYLKKTKTRTKAKDKKNSSHGGSIHTPNQMCTMGT